MHSSGGELHEYEKLLWRSMGKAIGQALGAVRIHGRVWLHNTTLSVNNPGAGKAPSLRWRCQGPAGRGALADGEPPAHRRRALQACAWQLSIHCTPNLSLKLAK